MLNRINSCNARGGPENWQNHILKLHPERRVTFQFQETFHFAESASTMQLQGRMNGCRIQDASLFDSIF